LSFYEGVRVRDLKIEESVLDVLCTDTTALSGTEDIEQLVTVTAYSDCVIYFPVSSTVERSYLSAVW
jgi:hypothetical protein